MEDKNKTCNTLPDSEKCYDTEHEVADYGKSYKEQVEETKGPSQEEFSNERYGDKTLADYPNETIEQNPMDQASRVNDYQSDVARNENSVAYINNQSNDKGYKEVPEDE